VLAGYLLAVEQFQLELQEIIQYLDQLLLQVVVVAVLPEQPVLLMAGLVAVKVAILILLLEL
jgi:hypothetical protein